MDKGQPAMKSPCGLSLLSIGLFMFLAITASEGATLARLRVGYPSPSASFFPLFATKEAGLLEKYGFDTEMVYVQGVQLVQVHVAGQLDVSTISSVVYLQASVEGADLIQVASSIDNQLMKLMVHPSITKPEDLRGKTLAVTRFGSLTDLLIRPVLKNWGLEPQKDVKLIQIGRMPDIATAIVQKSVDGGVISFPTSVQAEKMNIKTMLDFADSGFDLPATTVVVSRRYSKSNRDTVLRFLKAYIEGTRRLFTDRELGIRALRRYGGIRDRDMLSTTYDLFTSRYIKKIPTVNAKGVENSLGLIAESNPRAKGRKAEEFMDNSFMEELESTGFISSVWK
jgi:NitT/TauT family transport system substrate-binding protein